MLEILILRIGVALETLTSVMSRLQIEWVDGESMPLRIRGGE